MDKIYLTDDQEIFTRLSKLADSVLLIKTTYAIKINSAGIRLSTINHGKHQINITLDEQVASDRIVLDEKLNQLDSAILINLYKATNQSQFYFDMMLTQLTNNQKIEDVKRIWLNDINDLTNEVLVSNELEDNSAYAKNRVFHLVIEAVNAYWMYSNISSRENVRLNLFHYYILSMLYENHEAVRGSKQKAYFQIDANIPELNGKLLLKGRHMFESVQSATKAIESCTGPLMIQSSKYNEKETTKPLLYTYPSLAKDFSKLSTLKEVLTSLYAKGYITSPFSNNPTLPGTLINSIEDRVSTLGSRYQFQIEQVQKHGLTGAKLLQHLKNEYQNDILFNTDKTHAIIPIASKELALLSDTELYVYDAIVNRFLTMFFNKPIKYSKQVSIISPGDITLKFQKDGFVDIGHELLYYNAPSDERDSDNKTERKKLAQVYSLGSIVPRNILNLNIAGNLTRSTKQLSKSQIINGLIKMGRHTVSRSKMIRERNNILGEAAQWNSYIEYLVSIGMIDVDDTKLYALTDRGYSFLLSSRSYLVNTENLKNIFKPVLSILEKADSPIQIIENQVVALLEVEQSPTLQTHKPANYQYIINNFACVCGQNLREHENFLGCSSFPNCKFTIPKYLSGENHFYLSEQNLIDLLTQRETSEVIRAFTFRSGKKGNFKLGLDESNKLSYLFTR